jgi:hypothetical protein
VKAGVDLEVSVDGIGCLLCIRLESAVSGSNFDGPVRRDRQTLTGLLSMLALG